MTRFVRRATEGGVIEPRSQLEPERPRRGGTAARIVGAVGMVVLTGLLFWLLTDDGFRVTAADVRFDGLRHADEAAVRAHLVGLERSPNVFRVRASEIVSDLQSLPEVAAAVATVTLPAGVAVQVREREPIFTWSDRRTAWLVDGTGMLFAPTAPPSPVEDPADDDAAEAAEPGVDAAAQTGGDAAGAADPGDAVTDAPGAIAPQASAAEAPERSPELAPAPAVETASGSPTVDAEAPEDALADTSPLPAEEDAGLPLVEDQRLPEAPPAVGSYLPAIDLAVMRQLLALTPDLLGSKAESLRLRVDEFDGYVLSSDRGWQAVFGHYTPTLQPPEVVPRQVQCLRWLLAAEEKRLERVRLAVSDVACGTYTLFGKPAEERKAAEERRPVEEPKP